MAVLLFPHRSVDLAFCVIFPTKRAGPPARPRTLSFPVVCFCGLFRDTRYVRSLAEPAKKTFVSGTGMKKTTSVRGLWIFRYESLSVYTC